MTETVRLTLREKTFELPTIVGAEGEVGIDVIRMLSELKQSGEGIDSFFWTRLSERIAASG